MMAISFAMRETTLPVDCEAQTQAATRMDEETFRGFYDRTARPLWAYLVRMTGSPQVADDLLQETYYRFYRAGAAHENESHRRNSLFRIATNLVRDSGRRLRRGTEVPLEDNTRIVEARPEVRADLATALNKLKPHQREILWLAYAQGSSHTEIAEIVGVSTKSVKSMLFRARKKLAELLRG